MLWEDDGEQYSDSEEVYNLSDEDGASITLYAVWEKNSAKPEPTPSEEPGTAPSPEPGTTASPEPGTTQNPEPGTTPGTALDTPPTSTPSVAPNSDVSEAPEIIQITTLILKTNTDKGDVAGSSFSQLRLKGTGKNKSVKLTWNKVRGASGYIIYEAACGKQLKKAATVTGRSYVSKKLKKAKYYKYVVVAYKMVDGKASVMSISKSVHAVTNGGKAKNPTKVTIQNKKKTIKRLTLQKKNKKAKLSVKVKCKKLKVHIKKVRYESSNKKIFTVSSGGVVRAKKKGKAYLYAYSQSGVYKKIKVTVKK